MTWVLYEIAKRPEIQARMRTEILEMMNKVHARGDTEWTPLDLDSLHYTDAVIRVRVFLSLSLFFADTTWE